MGLEDQLERDAKDVVKYLVKSIVVLVVLFWPLGLIDGDAFGPNPTWWQWALGALAELPWLAVCTVVWFATRKDRKGTIAYALAHRSRPRGRTKRPGR